MKLLSVFEMRQSILLFIMLSALIFWFMPYHGIFASQMIFQSEDASRLVGAESSELKATNLESRVLSCQSRNVENSSTRNGRIQDLIETAYKSQVQPNSPSAQQNWPMFQHDSNHTGYYGGLAPSRNLTLWKSPVPCNIHQPSPVVADGRVFLGTFGGINKIYALNQSTGAILWSKEVASSIYRSVAYFDKKIYFGTVGPEHGEEKAPLFYCLNAVDGSLIWTYDPNLGSGEGFYSAPTISDGIVYVGVSYNLLALNATTGELVWSYSLGRRVFSSPAVAGNRVYVTYGLDGDDSLLCLNASNGELIWRFEYPDSDLSITFGTPSLANGRVFLEGSGVTKSTPHYVRSKVYCLNATNGELLWDYTPLGEVDYYRFSPALAYGKIYIASGGQLVCLDQSSGTPIWSSPQIGITYSPAVADGKIYIGSKNAIYCFDAITGAEIWKYTISDGEVYFATPAISDGKLFVTCTNGFLYAFGGDILIDDSKVSKSICEVNSTQTIYFHAVWVRNGSDVKNATLRVSCWYRGSEESVADYVTNASGWIKIEHRSSQIGRKRWYVTDVYYNNKYVEFVQTAPNPTIVWERANITTLPEDKIMWSEDIRITYDPKNAVWSDVAIDSRGNVHIVWQQENPEMNYRDEIFYTKIDRNGTIVITRKIASAEIGNWLKPSLVIDKNEKVHVVCEGTYEGHYIYYMKLDSTGAVLIGPKKISPKSAEAPSIAVDNLGNVHVIWHQFFSEPPPYGLDVVWRKLDNNGNFLTEMEQVGTAEWSRCSRITLDNQGNIHIIWVDGTNQQAEYIDSYYEIFYKKLSNNGTPLTGDILVANYSAYPTEYDGSIDWSAQLTVGSIDSDSDGNIHLVWSYSFPDETNSPIWEIYYKKIANDGTFLTRNTIVECDSVIQPKLAIGPSNDVHIIWCERKNEDYQIHYIRLDSDGNFITNKTPVTKILYSTSFSFFPPEIAVDKYDLIHIVWTGFRDGNLEIFYKKGAIGGPLLKLHFVDGDNETLVGLEVRLYNSSGNLVHAETVDSTGWINYTLIPLGTYTINSLWEGFLVANKTVEVSVRNPGVIIDPQVCGIYDYLIQVLDGDGEPVKNANVRLFLSNGSHYRSLCTNASGWAEFINLPNTTYHIRTFYQGTLVSDLTDTLSNEAQTKIVNAAIYDLFIQCVDGDEKVVSGAIVHLYNSTSLIKTVTTDAYGYAEFTQLPNTTYTFNITYFGVNVGEGSLTLSLEGQMETISLWIYDWNIKLLDGDGKALPNTKVEVYLWDGSLWGELRTTDKGFIRLLNFPSESYTFKAYWKGVKVLDVTLPLTSEEQTNNIQCAVFDLVVRVVDEEGNGLPNADVTLFWMNGTAITTTSTNSTGHTVFENMPGTTYSIKVTLKKYKDAREDITLTSEDQLTIITVQPLSKPFTSTPTGIATIAGVAIAGITVVMIVLIKKGIICK